MVKEKVINQEEASPKFEIVVKKEEVVKKAKEFVMLSESISSQTAPAFMSRVNSLLNEGYDLFASQSIGLDTGGGVSGAGNVMMVVTLVRYEFIKLMDAPA